MKTWLRRRLASFVYRHLFNGITENDVLRGHAGQLYYRGTVLSSSQVNGIISQAKDIQKSELWKLLMDDIRASANLKIFRSATNMDEIASARASLWTVDVLEKKLTTLAEMKFK